MEVAARGDVAMMDAEREEEARNRPEEVRELGIARAVIAREARPKPVEEWLEREIGGKRSSSWEDPWRLSSKTRLPR